jgi:hypothetical protein
MHSQIRLAFYNKKLDSNQTSEDNLIKAAHLVAAKEYQ